MRYEFVGRKTRYVGKTLWEILGNLKNFGVGRLVKKWDNHGCTSTFYKIVKVQPVPQPKNQFEDRRVIAWVEQVFRDKVFPVTSIYKNTNVAKFQLIPKIEEEQYLKRLEAETPIKYIKKYSYCPPLYKKLWEDENSNKQEMPKIKSIVTDYLVHDIVLEDAQMEPDTCSLYKTMTVDDMYKELVRLKKIIKANTEVQQ